MQVTNDVALLDFEYNQSIIAKRHHLGKTDIKIVELFKIDSTYDCSMQMSTQFLLKLEQVGSMEYMTNSYFDFQRIGAVASLFGIDEISIQQGFCSNVSVTVTTVNGVSKSTIPIRTTESETSMTITMESPIITTDKSTIISDETITSISAKSEDILHNTTTMEIITDAAKKTTTSKSMPTGISTSIITENIELPSVANLSHVTTTAID
ncbi:unnamed protein product [Rotaria socialis]